MKTNQGPVAAINSDEQETVARLERGEARRKAFASWMRGEGSEIVNEVKDAPRICSDMNNDRLVEHYLWCAFKAGEKHGRASR